jgi:hypothetical protein
LSGTVWLWEWLSAEQRAAAVKGREGVGLEGLPPSGPHGVLWMQDENGWRWKTGLCPNDLRQGIRIGEPLTPGALYVQGLPGDQITIATPDGLRTYVPPSAPAKEEELDLAPARALAKALRGKPRPTAVTMPWALRDVPLAGASPPAVRTSPGPARAAKTRKGRR